MGAYEMSLKAGSFNSAASQDAKPCKSGSIGSDDWNSSRGKGSKRNESPKEMFGFGLFQTKRVASQQSLEELMQQSISPPRHSTACCDGLSLQRESSTERRLSSKASLSLHDRSFDSFRSDDSDNLALWEESETSSNATDRDVWMKHTATQSPRWMDAMAKLTPWRSSPVHPKSGDTPRLALDRKPSTRSLHESTKAWYNKKKWNPRLVRQSGELNPMLVTDSTKWERDRVTSEDGGSFSRTTEEDTRFTPSAVVWDIPHHPQPVFVENQRRVRGQSREIPAEVENGNGNAETMDARDVTEYANASEVLVKDCGDSARSESISDGHSEYASCRILLEDELLSEGDSLDTKPDDFVNVIDFVSPLITKLQSMERKEDMPLKGAEARVLFSWEAGPKLRADKVAPTTLTPQPPPIRSSTPYETLREQYIQQSKSAPLDGLYLFLPQSGSSKIPLPWVKEATTNSILTKSKSFNDELRRLNRSADHRLFTKLRKAVLGTGPSPHGKKNNEYVESSSPRSILRGPDDGMSVPSSSNPSLRSDPDTSAFSARPTSTSQSMSSCSASFDLNEGDYEMAFKSNSSAACIVVESRRVSLSFRDFGPAQPSDMVEASLTPTSNVELRGCDGQLDTSASRSSPEFWTATISARYLDSDLPDSACARESEVTELSSPPPVRQLAYLMSCEDEQEQEQRRSTLPQKSRSRNHSEFTARLGVMFSPLRLMSSHESSNHGCFVTTTLSPPHDEGDEARSPTFAATVKIVSPVQLRSSSMKPRKTSGSWTNAEIVKSRSSKRRQASNDPQTMMVTLSKAMKKILSKCTVKRSTSKGKSKTDAPALAALSPPEFQFS